MIIGTGSDLCDIRRIEKAMERFGDRFLQRVFTETERARAARRHPRIQPATFAKRFAAKEACAKALGTGFRMGVFHSDMGVVNLPSGQPTLALTGGAATRLAAITPAGQVAAIHLTITDEHPYAFAQVTIDGKPRMSGATRAVDWEARYRAERTPWERPTLNPAFVTWRSSGALTPCRILLPGAGRSGEPLALARDGFDVTVADSAPTSLAVQRARFETAPLPGTLLEVDLLEWTPGQCFDAIYDQTCLCALPPATWPQYAARLHDWLAPEGRLFILFMQTGRTDGPPFDCPPEAMRALFAAGWAWPETLGAPVPHGPAAREIPVILRRV